MRATQWLGTTSQQALFRKVGKWRKGSGRSDVQQEGPGLSGQVSGAEGKTRILGCTRYGCQGR